jgi:hypothetical protein
MFADNDTRVFEADCTGESPMSNRCFTLFILAIALSASAAAAPGGTVTLPQDKFGGYFYRMPEHGLVWPRSSDEIHRALNAYDEGFDGMYFEELGQNLGNFPGLQQWSKPGEEAAIGRGELLSFFNHDLSIAGTRPLTPAQAKSVLSTELLHLVGWHGPHDAEYIKHIVTNREVRYVFLAGTGRYSLKAEGVEELAGGRDLAGLGLAGQGVSDEAVILAFCKALQKHRKTLRYLYLERLAPQMLPYLSELKKLETLEIVSLNGRWTETQAAEWNSFLSAQGRLRQVYLTDSQFTDDWLTPLAAATNLRALSVNSDATGSFLGALKLAKLEEINLQCAKLATLEPLAGCKSLRRVFVRHCATAETLASLLKLYWLELLLLRDCAGVDDAFVEGMNCKQLRALELSGKTKLTVKGLDRIGEFESLHSLNLSSQPLTDEILIRYAKELEQLVNLDIPKGCEPGEAAIDAWLQHRNVRSFDFEFKRISQAKLYEMIEHLRANCRKWSERRKDKSDSFKVGR